MAETRRKRLAANERRQVILRAALLEFARTGYQAASMDRIAQGAGVSKPVLYDHFPSKLSLYAGALEQVREQLLALGSDPSAEAPDGREGVLAVITAFFRFVERDPMSVRVLLQVPNGSDDALRVADDVQRVATMGIMRLLSSRLALDPAQLDLVAEFLKSGLHRLAQISLETPNFDADAVAELATRLIWSGLGHIDDAPHAGKSERSGKT